MHFFHQLKNIHGYIKIFKGLNEEGFMAKKIIDDGTKVYLYATKKDQGSEMNYWLVEVRNKEYKGHFALKKEDIKQKILELNNSNIEALFPEKVQDLPQLPANVISKNSLEFIALSKKDLESPKP